VTELTQKLERFEEALAPLVDIALSQGMSVNELQRVLRQLFVRRAAEQLRSRGEPVSVARLAVASGANRSEVRSTIQELESRESARTSGARLRARIPELLSVWTNDPRFSGPYGAVRNLFIGDSTFNHERESSFSALTNIVDPRIDPAEAAEMLVQAGCASWADTDRKSLKFEKVTYIPGPDGESAADQHFQQSMRMLVGAARTTARNLTTIDRSARLLHRAVVADHPLALAEAKVLLDYAETNFGLALSQADQFISALPPAVGERGHRYGIGIFVFEDEPLAPSSAVTSLVEPDAPIPMHAEA
jgi:hypothetical protein